MEIFRDAAADAPGRKFSKTLSDFERMGIEGQLSILQREFPISVEWVTRLTGYNRARNCLAHRAGVVGSLDTTDSNELVIRWLVAKLAVTEGIPNDSVDVKGPMNNLVLRQLISGDLAMSVALLDREKRVSAGSSLHFLPSEVLEICQTFQLASAAFSTIAAR